MSAPVAILPVVMAGGSGTRLWPLSRALYPKQFLALAGPQTLFQSATARLLSLAGPGVQVAAPCIVANEEHRFMVLDQLREMGCQPGAVLLEPTGRNTAPALTLAALHATAQGTAALHSLHAPHALHPVQPQDATDPILVVTPADQTVTRPDAFTAALRQAVVAAADGSVVILGIVADRPETGFGYIRTHGSAGRLGSADEPDGSAGSAAATPAVLDVAAFVEKPDAPTAERYLREGSHYWNSGMFVLRASTWLKALAQFRPDIEQATRAAWAARSIDAHVAGGAGGINGAAGTISPNSAASPFIRPDRALFEAIPSESIDYAVMEACTRAGSGWDVKMVPLDAGWSDLGAWDAVWQVSARDAAGNASSGDALFEDSRNTLVHATSRLVSAVGLDNIVVVETPDAVLVADRSKSQDVKAIVATLKTHGRSEGTLHRRVHRPWGSYDSIDNGPRFQVKRIVVKPGATLSLQMHHHRAEHWIVVSGTAEVTNGESVTILTENQSTYIPLGQTHRLANPGKLPLEIIEVQSGSYLGEDDIVRFEDTYGRK